MAKESDLFADFLRKRIFDYNAFGILMHVNKDFMDDAHYLSNLLAIDSEYFVRAIRYSDLSDKTGERNLYPKWP